MHFMNKMNASSLLVRLANRAHGFPTTPNLLQDEWRSAKGEGYCSQASPHGVAFKRKHMESNHHINQWFNDKN